MDKLELMKTFVAVVQEGAFTRAANKQELSPQLVSKYVSALEKNLQTRLLHRTTRKVTPTEAGKHYYSRCVQVLDEISEIEHSLVDWHQRVSGTLTINAPMSFGHRHLPKLLSDFQARYPEVEFKLQLTDQKVDIVEQGVDVALRIGALKSDNIIARRIAPIEVAVLASPDYLQRRGEPTTPEQLSGHALLHYSYAEPNQLSMLRGVKPGELALSQPIAANNGDMLVSMAELGAGIAIQPTFIAEHAIRSGRLKKILCQHQPKNLDLYLIYANRQFLPSKVRAFIDFASEYYGETPYWDSQDSEAAS